MKRAKFGKQFVFLVTTLLVGGVLVIPATAQPVLADNEPGSFLVYPRFDIMDEGTTQLRITNNGESLVRVRFNFICPGVKNGAGCDAVDVHRTLTPHETLELTVLASQPDGEQPTSLDVVIPPCLSGFVVAFAENVGGVPISYNHLIGSYHIGTDGPAVAGENAIAIQSGHADFTQLGGPDGGLRFGSRREDGSDYVHLGTVLSTDFRATVGEPRQEREEYSRLQLLTLDIRAGAQNPPVLVGINFWNQNEIAFSTAHEFVCYTSVFLDEIDPNFLAANLGTPLGSMQITPIGNCPIPGLCPHIFPSYDPTILGSITEVTEGTATERTLYHDRVPRATVYFPR